MAGEGGLEPPSLRLGSMDLLSGLGLLGPGWERHSPRSDDAFQTFVLPVLIVFIVSFPFTVPTFVVFFAAAFDFATVFAPDSAFAFDPKLTAAPAITLTLASALIVTRELATPPTKLATEPSRNIVLAKLEQNLYFIAGLNSVR
jgi:hypothetical protein